MTETEADIQLEAETARLRALLVVDETVPPGMLSRLQSRVALEATSDAPPGWECRLVVACLVYAALAGGAPSAASPGVFAPIAAAVALAYVGIASWPPGRAGRSSPGA